jgi:diguanylate cyclase (GGDEF)-like protein
VEEIVDREQGQSPTVGVTNTDPLGYVRDEVRLMGVLQVAGPLLALVGLALAPPAGIFWPGVLATVAGCAGLGVMALAGRAGPLGDLRFLSGATTVFITTGLVSSGDAAGLTLFYLWAVLPGATVLSRRALGFQVILAGAGISVALLLGLPDQQGFARSWLLATVTMAGTVWLVSLLAARLRRSEETLRRRAARSEALGVLAEWAVEASNEMPFLRDALGLLTATLGAPLGEVVLVDDGVLRVAAWTGPDGAALDDDVTVPLEDVSLASEVLAAPGPVMVEPGRGHLGLCRHDEGPAVMTALRRADGPPFGIIAFHTTERAHLTAGEVTFLTAAAHTMASAMARHRAFATVAHQARHDALTGLPNRTQLEEAFHRRLAGRLADETVALLLLDLDRFKDVNDALGHDVGDRVLMEVADRLRRTLRAGDVVARLGGDEYAVLAGGLHTPGDAEAVARAVLGALEAPFTTAGVSLQIAASVGIALAPTHGHDLTTLLRRADLAMYQAKGNGDGYRFFRPDTPGDNPADLILVADLRHAIEHGALTVAYQPLVDFATGRVVGAEALARWNHPQRGAIPPVEFIPLAEHTGLIRPLTRLVLGEAVAEAGRWHAQGLDLSVAVNLSVHALHDPELLPGLRTALAASGLPPGALVLELTESAFAHAESTHPIRALHHLGTRLSIDDFGTGYSSVAYLKRLPVSELKIDQSFVRGLATDPQDRHIVAALVTLAHGLGLRVVAEGIEDQTIADACAALGCDTAQGYFYARPGPPEAVVALAARDHHQDPTGSAKVLSA